MIYSTWAAKGKFGWFGDLQIELAVWNWPQCEISPPLGSNDSSIWTNHDVSNFHSTLSKASVFLLSSSFSLKNWKIRDYFSSKGSQNLFLSELTFCSQGNVWGALKSLTKSCPFRCAEMKSPTLESLFQTVHVDCWSCLMMDNFVWFFCALSYQCKQVGSLLYCYRDFGGFRVFDPYNFVVCNLGNLRPLIMGYPRWYLRSKRKLTVFCASYFCSNLYMTVNYYSFLCWTSA